MSEMPKDQSKPNGGPSPEKKGDNWLVEGVQRLGKYAVDALSAVGGRESGKRAKDTSSTIAPEYPVYPEPSFSEFVTTPDGNRSPVESGNTPAALIEPTKPTSRDIHRDERGGVVGGAAAKYLNSVEPSTPEEQASDSTKDASGSSAEKNIPVSEPPEPTPDELARIKWNDYMRDAAAKRSVLVHSTTEEGLRELESFGVDIYSRYSPEVVSRYKGENVIDKDMFSTTIPNVDKPKKDDNPEGLTLYEQAMRDKYLGYEHDDADDAEKTEMSVEEHKAAANLKIARERFAKASIAVETHFFKKHFGGKKRQAELEAAAEQLKQCELEYMRLKSADKIEAAKQDPEKQAELAAEMAQAAFASMQETSRMTTDKYDDMLDDRGKFKKAAAKVGKWFNKGGKIAQWLKLGGAGFVGGAIVGSVAAWPITTAVGIVTGLGVAGATKQAVLEEHRGEDRTANVSLGIIDPAVANIKIGDVMEHTVNVSVDILKDASTERQNALCKKVRSSLGKYGLGFALGGFAGKFIGDWANSAHATGVEGNADTPSQSGSNQIPQSGSEQVPQSGGTPSVDNSVDKIVNSVNPDTPNFSSYDYPWDWAAEKFGNANAMDQLHNLADKAMADGHTVQWFNNPDGSVWMKVDGSSVTADVLKVLNKYA